jgi:hypothetical protein
MSDEIRRFTKDQFTLALSTVHAQGVIEGIDMTLKVLRSACAQLNAPENQHINSFILSITDILETSLRNPLHDHLTTAHRQHHDDLLPKLPPEVSS